MPRKAKTTEQEIPETGMEMEQQPAAGETPAEGAVGGQSGLPDSEHTEPGAGGLPGGTEEESYYSCSFI